MRAFVEAPTPAEILNDVAPARSANFPLTEK
jgi:hypothetical protein